MIDLQGDLQYDQRYKWPSETKIIHETFNGILGMLQMLAEPK